MLPVVAPISMLSQPFQLRDMSVLQALLQATILQPRRTGLTYKSDESPIHLRAAQTDGLGLIRLIHWGRVVHLEGRDKM